MNTALAIAQPAAALPDMSFRGLGLSEADRPRVLELSRQLENPSPNTVHAFGRDASRRTAEFADTMLEEVRNTDLGKTGERLGDVVKLARQIDLKQIANRSNVPVLGPLIDRFRTTRDDIVQSFSSTRTQIDQLLVDIDGTQRSMLSRNEQLETMLQAVREEHHEMGLHIAAGELALAELATRRAGLAAEGQHDPMKAQEAADVESAMGLLEKRVADLRVLQHAALQAIPTIRLIQTQNTVLADKFENIRELTVPAWKRAFVLQLSLNDQANAVKLAKSIDDTTNAMLRHSADLLYANAVSTAKANQRLVIDVDTLRHVHTKLIETLQDVRKANEDGITARQATERQLLTLRADVQSRLAPPSVTAH